MQQIKRLYQAIGFSRFIIMVFLAVLVLHLHCIWTVEPSFPMCWSVSGLTASLF